MVCPLFSHARAPWAACVVVRAIRKATTPAAPQVARYPVVKATGRTRDLLIRAYRATVGETEGNIIAAIITIHTPRNQPKVPRALQGPVSMPRISPAVHHQPTAASAKRAATIP